MPNTIDPLIYDIYEGEIFFSKENGEKGFALIQDYKHKINREFGEKLLKVKLLKEGFDFSSKEVEKIERDFIEEKDWVDFEKASMEVLDETEDDLYYVFYDGYQAYFFIFEGNYYYALNCGTNIFEDNEFLFFKVGDKEKAKSLSQWLHSSEHREFNCFLTKMVEEEIEPIVRVDSNNGYTRFLVKNLAKRHVNFLLNKYKCPLYLFD